MNGEAGNGWRDGSGFRSGSALRRCFCGAPGQHGQRLGISLLLVLPGLWLRGYAAGYVRKNAELTTSGPYAYTRNPLYVGSMMIAFGFAAAARSTLIFVVLDCAVCAHLPAHHSFEEAFLNTAFPEFAAYSQRVPRLLPRLRATGERVPSAGFDRTRYLHHREYNSGIGTLAIYAALIAKILWLGRG